MGRPFVVSSSDEYESDLKKVAIYRFGCEDEDDEDDEYNLLDRDDDDYLQKVTKLHVKRFNEFLDDNPKLANVDAICIETRYTDRVLNNPELMEQFKPAVVYTDKLWDDNDTETYIAPGCRHL
jgi:hypothetical protein